MPCPVCTENARVAPGDARDECICPSNYYAVSGSVIEQSGITVDLQCNPVPSLIYSPAVITTRENRGIEPSTPTKSALLPHPASPYTVTVASGEAVNLRLVPLTSAAALQTLGLVAAGQDADLVGNLTVRASAGLLANLYDASRLELNFWDFEPLADLVGPDGVEFDFRIDLSFRIVADDGVEGTPCAAGQEFSLACTQSTASTVPITLRIDNVFDLPHYRLAGRRIAIRENDPGLPTASGPSVAWPQHP